MWLDVCSDPLLFFGHWVTNFTLVCINYYRMHIAATCVHNVYYFMYIFFMIEICREKMTKKPACNYNLWLHIVLMAAMNCLQFVLRWGLTCLIFASLPCMWFLWAFLIYNIVLYFWIASIVFFYTGNWNLAVVMVWF